MINLDRVILKEDYTLEDLKKEKRIIYFDIDSTLGGSSLHHGIYSFEKYRNEKKVQCDAFKKRHGVNFSIMDFRAVDIMCLAMFLKTLKETNSVAFCISSWMSSSRIRAGAVGMNPITLIEKVFQETFPEWESGIIVGGSPESPTSRGDFCKEMSEYSNSDYFVIDDSHHEYKIREGLIEVDGNCGYVYRDHRKIIETWSE